MRDSARRGVAVGFFDGVHLGHRAILSLAEEALTFRVHPLSVVDPARAPRLLMGLDSRIAAMRECGVARVTALDFTSETAHVTAAEFASRALSGASRVICGEDWRFGRGGEGDAGFLRRLGFEVEVVPPALFDGRRISSTRIRESLEAGAVECAAAMLGRHWSMAGEVFAGKGMGASIGFPTLNIRPEARCARLRRGAYAVEMGGLRGVANYGVAPTMGGDAWEEEVLEVHFPGSVPPPCPPGSLCSVSFLWFIRDERKFPSADDLRRQIAADCAAAANYGIMRP